MYTAHRKGAAGLVTTDRRGSVLVVACHGELDLAAREDLRAGLAGVRLVPGADPTDELGDAPGGLVVDLTDVPFLDCSALGVLMPFVERYERTGRRVRLAGAAPVVGQLLRALDLDSRLGLVPDVEQAVALVRGPDVAVSHDPAHPPHPGC